MIIIFGSVFGSTMLQLTAGLLYRVLRQHQHAILIPNKIEEGRFVEIGNLDQWIQGRRNPFGLSNHYVVDGGKRRIILAVLVTPGEVIDNHPMLDLQYLELEIHELDLHK